MDPYVVSLLTGAVGMGAMALGGATSHGHSGGTAHGHSGGVGHGHATGASHSHGTDAGRGGAVSGVAHGGSMAVHHAVGSSTWRTVWAVVSPRVLFSVLLGLGATGVVFRPLLGGVLLFVAACAGGVIFERGIVAPIWNFALRFASRPALSLESAVTDEATVVSTFNTSGQGLVEIEIDGRMVQVLGTLQSPDLAAGVRPRTGDRVRIEAVDADRNRCTVSVL
jgi:hypothetical protein